MNKTLSPMAVALVIGLSGSGLAQSAMDHSNMSGTGQTNMQGPTETGQSSFAAIAEIVAILQADPDTDWNIVDIAALRAHLVDMDAVTLRSEVSVSNIASGAVFDVTSADPDVAGSVRRMLLAHVQTMSGFDQMTMQSQEIANGVRFTVTGPNTAKIRGLGLFGILTLGAHHQPHHMALANGTYMPQN